MWGRFQSFLQRQGQAKNSQTGQSHSVTSFGRVYLERSSLRSQGRLHQKRRSESSREGSCRRRTALQPILADHPIP